MEHKHTPDKPVVIIYKESLAQSIISDLATFGLLLLCIWVSRDSAWWTLVTGCMFLFNVIMQAIAFTKSSNILRFYSLDDMQEWINKQRQENPNDH